MGTCAVDKIIEKGNFQHKYLDEKTQFIKYVGQNNLRRYP